MAEVIAARHIFPSRGFRGMIVDVIDGTLYPFNGQTLTRIVWFQEVEQLPDENKSAVKKLLDAFLLKKHIQALTR